MSGSLSYSAMRARDGRVRASERPISGRRLRPAVIGRVVVPAATLAVLALALLGTPANAATFMPSSKQVALIPSNNPPSSPGNLGVMPISSYVSGRPSESFDKFSFKYVALNAITSATLSNFDTVALIQVHTSDLSSAAKAALAQFVANGGKVLIHDSDEASLNDYSWLLPGGYSTKIGAGCNACGRTSGNSTIIENSGLISANPADPAYVSIPELTKYTDSIGDANLLVSDDPRWFAAARGTNASNEAGAQLAYASNNGLVVYNGFDTDMIKPQASGAWRCINTANNVCPANSHPSVDWLAQMWYAELNQSWGSGPNPPSTPNGLPQTSPVSGIGTPLPPSQAGLPAGRGCVAKRKLFLRLTNLGTRRQKVVQVDVYVNGRHVFRERGKRLHNTTLRHLPQTGKVVVRIVATTNRRYHLISTKRYRAC
jgi:hypothetical protein